jgi:hypothetical protein
MMMMKKDHDIINYYILFRVCLFFSLSLLRFKVDPRELLLYVYSTAQPFMLSRFGGHRKKTPTQSMKNSNPSSTTSSVSAVGDGSTGGGGDGSSTTVGGDGGGDNVVDDDDDDESGSSSDEDDDSEDEEEKLSWEAQRTVVEDDEDEEEDEDEDEEEGADDDEEKNKKGEHEEEQDNDSEQESSPLKAPPTTPSSSSAPSSATKLKLKLSKSAKKRQLDQKKANRRMLLDASTSWVPSMAAGDRLRDGGGAVRHTMLQAGEASSSGRVSKKARAFAAVQVSDNNYS